MSDFNSGASFDGSVPSHAEDLAFQVSVQAPVDICDIAVVFSQTGLTGDIRATDAVEAVIRKASLHFQSIGYSSLRVELLREQLADQLERLLAGESSQQADVRGVVMDALNTYKEEESKRLAVRWRSRIGLAADGFTLVSMAQAAAGFIAGTLLGGASAGSGKSYGEDRTLILPYPLKGLHWRDHKSSPRRPLVSFLDVWLVQGDGIGVVRLLCGPGLRTVIRPGSWEPLQWVKRATFSFEGEVLAQFGRPFNAKLIIPGVDYPGTLKGNNLEIALKLPLGWP